MTSLNELTKKFEGCRVLITGGAGFIGSHLGRHLLAAGAEVRILDNLSTGLRTNLPEGAEFHMGSVTSPEQALESAEGCAYVFHEAAMVSVPESIEQPDTCLAVNVAGTHNVLEAARRAGARRIVFAASAAAYGAAPTLPSREEHPPDSYSPYAFSKVAGEQMLTAYARCYGVSAVSLRYFNIFGPRQNPDSPYAAVISAFLKAIDAGRSPVVHGDGLQTRDFTHVDNVVYANLLAATSAQPVAGEIFNIGTGARISLLDVLDVMRRALDTPIRPQFAEARPGDIRHSQADITRARDVLGYAPIVGFEEGMTRMLQERRTASE